MSMEYVAEVFFAGHASDSQEENADGGQARERTLSSVQARETTQSGGPAREATQSGGQVELEGGDFLGDLEAGEGAEPLPEAEFISVKSLSLEHLPERIRSQDNLRFILDLSKRVVCINNNRLSSLRPPSFKFGDQTNLKGSGIVFFIEGNIAVVSTNRHVLYDDEEVKHATIDLFFDLPLAEAVRAGQIRRVQRGRGVGTMRTNQEEDFTLALFRLDKELIDRLKDPSADDRQVFSLMTNKQAFPELFRRVPPSLYGDSCEKTVCVIGHPLGRQKCVTFGRIVGEDARSRGLSHDAPTRRGSSGSPVLVFSSSPPDVPPNSVWYHIGSHADGKLAHLQVNDTQLFDVDMVSDDRFELDLISDSLGYRQPSTGLVARWLGAGEFTRAVSFSSASERMLTLALHLGASLPTADHTEVRKLQEHFRSPIQEALRTQMTTLECATPMADLSVCIQGARGACHCPLLLDAVTSRPGQQGRIASQMLLPPQTTPRGLRHRRTWPFGPGSVSSPADRRSDGGGECIVDDLVKDLREQDPCDKFIFAYFLMLLQRLADVMKSSRSTDTPTEQSDRLPAASPHNDGHLDPGSAVPDVSIRVLKATLDLMDFGLSLYDATAMHVILFGRQFLDLADQLISGRDEVAEAEDRDAVPGRRAGESGGVRESCPPSLGATPGAGAQDPTTEEEREALEDVRVLLNHAHAHYSQSRGDAVEGGRRRRGCGCGRPVPRQLADAATHVRALVQQRLASHNANETQEGADQGGKTSQTPPKSGAGSETGPSGQGLDRGTGGRAEKDEQGQGQHPGSGESQVSSEEARGEGVREAGEGDTQTQGATAAGKGQAARDAGPVFREVLNRLKGQLLLAIMASFFMDAGGKSEQQSNAELAFVQELSTLEDVGDPLLFLTKTLNTVKASLNSLVAYLCLRERQKGPAASSRETTAQTNPSWMRTKLGDGLLFTRRFLGAVEVFLFNSRILLEQWHRALGCSCDHYDLRSPCAQGSSGQGSGVNAGGEAAGEGAKPEGLPAGGQGKRRKEGDEGVDFVGVLCGAMNAAGLDLGSVGSGQALKGQPSRGSSSSDVMEPDLD